MVTDSATVTMESL